jgi:flagellar basal body P-ring formation protein FlgA
MNRHSPLPELSGRHIAAVTVATCLMILGLGVAAAFSQARLRPIAQVEADVVRLGDLIDGAGQRADIAVFGAPSPGQSGMISAARIVSAARDHGLPEVETNGLSSVAVRRLGRTIGAEEIAAAIREAIVAQQRLAPDTEIELSSGQMEAVVESVGTGPVVVRSLSYNGASGRFEATYVAQGSRALELSPAKVVGNVSDVVRVPVLGRAILKGDVVAAADVTLERRRRSELGSDILTDASRVVGNAAKRPMGRGSLIREADVQRPELVERNAVIMMTFEQPGMQLQMRGKALAAGAIGDTIQVQNISSKKTIEAVVTGPNRAAVTGAVFSQQKTTLRGDVRAQ